MNEQDIQEFKKRLEAEKTRLSKELESIGRQLNDEGDWVAMPPVDEDGFRADKNENADNVEDFQENVAILTELEKQYSEVLGALGRIADGSYGTCSVSGEAIERERLEANPSASTCMAHME